MPGAPSASAARGPAARAGRCCGRRACWALLGLALLLAGCRNDNPYRPVRNLTPLPPPAPAQTVPWVAQPALNVPRWGLAAVVGPLGTLYAIGGADSAGVPLATVESLTTLFGTGGGWALRAPMNTPRSGLAAVAIGSKIYALGGSDAAGNPLDTVEIYDTSADTWTTVPTGQELVEPRADFCAVSPDDVHIPLIGGHNATGESATVWVYDASQPTFQAGFNGPMPVAQDGHPACVQVGSGTTAKVYALGGRNVANGTAPLDASSLLTWQTASWSAAPALLTAREGVAGAELNGLVYALGGRDVGTDLDVVEAYDPVATTWKTRAPMAAARDRAAAVSDGGRVYVIGGRAGNSALDAVERYDPSADPTP